METETTKAKTTDQVLSPIDSNGSIFADLLGHAVSNFEGDARQRMRLDMLAVGSKCNDEDKEDGAKFPIKYFYIHKVEILNPKTGELSPSTRTVLVSPDLKTIDFCSDGVAQSLALIVKNLGMGPYDPAIDVEIRSRKLKNGHRMTDLIPIFS